MSSLIEELNPTFQPVARALLAELQEDLDAEYPGSVVRPAVTFRNLSDQAAARAAGLSKVSMGWHQFGLAMDVAIIDKNGQYVKDGEDERYRLFGQVAKTRGCIWGGDWTQADWDHCEHHPGFTLTQYVAWLDAHRIVTA